MRCDRMDCVSEECSAYDGNRLIVMAREKLDLRSLLDVPMWELVQDQLARLTGTAIITVDYKGYPITKHSRRTPFCSVIRENPILRKRCFRCDALAALEAVRLERPYIYLCHCGIVDVAVPVLVGDRYLGAVMFGQVRIPDNNAGVKVDRLVNEISTFQPDDEINRKDLLEKYELLPEMEYARIVQIADFIAAIVNYIVDKAVSKQNDVQTYEWMLQMNSDMHVSTDDDIQELRQPEESIKYSDSNPVDVKKSSVIYPAISYISDHLNEPIMMNEMAALCHLSPTYFSRIFHRDVGESFTTYVSRKKVEVAKHMLRDTNKSVSQIAYDLGYLNTSHFIAIFKKFVGTSPLIYRQYKYEKET